MRILKKLIALVLAVVLCVGLATYIVKYRPGRSVGPVSAPSIPVASARPLELVSGPWPYGHCQGVAVDEANGFVYYSFTTALVKTDMQGNLLGSVVGMLGHLGCIEFHEGRIYGSLEYKQDSIGQGVLANAGSDAVLEEAFYIAIFDGADIVDVDMDAADVMKTVYMPEVMADYTAGNYGCSGIDGVTFGPIPGSDDPTLYLYAAYGLYQDNERADNDHQVLLCYDISDWDALALPLDESAMHKSGPNAPLHKYFILTGNTNWGVQNLEYDSYTNTFMLATYGGSKPGFPTNAFFMADASIPATLESGRETLSLAPIGESHESGVYSWNFPYGSYGLHAFGDGTYYIAMRESVDSGERARIQTFQWNGEKVAMKRVR